MEKFAQLISPYSLEDFFQKIWDKTFLHIQGAPGKLSFLPSFSEFPDLFVGELNGESWQATPYEGRVQASWVEDDGSIKLFNTTRAQAAHLYNTGASLCYGPIDNLHKAFQELADSVGTASGFDGQVCTTAYLTPPGSGGDLHFDDQHVFFMQVAGEKHWKVSTEPAIQWPASNLLAANLEDESLVEQIEGLGWQVTPPKDATFVDILLKEGDVLYMPPGVWHEPRTIDTHSLHYTLTLSNLSSWSTLFTFIKFTMLQNAEWRRDLRFLKESSDEEAKEVVERMLDGMRDVLSGVSAEEVLGLYRQTSQIPGPLKSLFQSI